MEITNFLIFSYQMTVRASVPIMRGEQVFSSYALALEGKYLFKKK